ncbi:MAG: AbrB/MazE/SpoVT family DNA-binding domain-containing protein [Candidatus Woesearchaeota archaeon]
MTSIELINVGEKGQIVIPKKLRDLFHIEKGTKLLITKENNKIILKKAEVKEEQLWMLVSEESLSETWNNKHDKRWNDVL